MLFAISRPLLSRSRGLIVDKDSALVANHHHGSPSHKPQDLGSREKIFGPVFLDWDREPKGISGLMVNRRTGPPVAIRRNWACHGVFSSKEGYNEPLLSSGALSQVSLNPVILGLSANGKRFCKRDF